MKGVEVREVEHKWGAVNVKLPGSVVDCDVAAGHDGCHQGARALELSQ